MAQPDFAPITEADQVRPARRLQVPGRWVPDRPGDFSGPGQPTGALRGTPGPDQGFALRLARRYEDRLNLSEGEDEEDVIVGAAVLASRRAALVGRAPCSFDIEAALTLFGFLSPTAPADLVDERRRRFAAASHHYVVQRELVDLVPRETLLKPAAELRDQIGDWRTLLWG
jgi:hypothetical protein